MAVDVFPRGAGDQSQRNLDGHAVITLAGLKIIGTAQRRIFQLYLIGKLRYFFFIRFTGN